MNTIAIFSQSPNKAQKSKQYIGTAASSSATQAVLSPWKSKLQAIKDSVFKSAQKQSIAKIKEFTPSPTKKLKNQQQKEQASKFGDDEDLESAQRPIIKPPKNSVFQIAPMKLSVMSPSKRVEVDIKEEDEGGVSEAEVKRILELYNTSMDQCTIKNESLKEEVNNLIMNYHEEDKIIY